MEENKEKKMRTVELTVWTGYLGMVDITPVSKSYANGYIGSGEEPDDVYDRFEDTHSVYFVNGNENVNLKVMDGDKEMSFDELPQLDFDIADDYREMTLEDWLDNTDLDEDEWPKGEDAIMEWLNENYEQEEGEFTAWKVLQKANLDDAPGVFLPIMGRVQGRWISEFRGTPPTASQRIQ